jgi:hypothetical protein
MAKFAEVEQEMVEQESLNKTIEEQRAEIERLTVMLAQMKSGHNIITLPNGDLYLLNATERVDTVPPMTPRDYKSMDVKSKQAVAAQMARAISTSAGPVDLPTRDFARMVLDEAIEDVERNG